MPTMIHRNAVKELNLVISVIHEVWIEDRIKRRPSEHSIGLDVGLWSEGSDCIRFRVHPLLLSDECLSLIPYSGSHVIHRTMVLDLLVVHRSLHSYLCHRNPLPTIV